MTDLFKLVCHLTSEFIFTGYGMYSFIFIGWSVAGRKQDLIKILDKSARLLIVFSGIIYLFSFLLFTLITIVEDPDGSLANRLSGPYWYGYWIQLGIWTLATQLLWWDKLRKTKFMRFILSLFFIVSFERYVILISTLHSSQAGWGELPLSDWLQGLLLKGLIVTLMAYFISLIVRKGNQKVKFLSVFKSNNNNGIENR